MSDLYTELLVPRRATAGDQVLKAVLIAVTVLSGIVGLFITPIGFLFLIGFAVLDYFKLPALNLEFEYLYVNGELDVDKIMSKQKRKRAGSYEIEKAELIALWKSHDMDYYRQGNKGKVVDYTSRTDESKVYAMVYNGDKGMEIILLELNDVMLKDIRRIAPRKVKLG
ncbi:MAG: DUF6106 family protein [Lachnospiraceae bacterium]|jgi:hypothetical protein|nr:DUF6106 family protein [Lachnospiraceae bacterium]